jgi:hypothetical protein
MRRAQSVSICENTIVDMQRQTSLTLTRPMTPLKSFVNTTTVQLDSNENGN